ncbi:MAG: NADH:flavin oxidoreductase [Myxococcales bacterium]|jgi:2,4-dienoyl-CoA reductase-like NADH-dependent reductase (Old Yellow Enzyme family)
MTGGSDRPSLFSPFEHKTLSLRNRFCMAPMTRQKSPGGVPTDEVVKYYQRRARHGVGLIITEGTTVDHPVASLAPDVPTFHGHEALAAWKHVVDAVHAEGGAVIPQLWHVGMARKPRTEPHPELPSHGPSGLVRPGKLKGHVMTQQDIDDVVGAFGRAAGEAKRLGFDGVELHGAHGYLIDQFFWAGTNQRDDAYGGSIEARARFGVEIVRAVREAVGPDFAVVLRFSQWKQQDFAARLATTPQELERFLSPLSEAGVDIFHCSTRRFWESEFPEQSDENLAGWTRRLTGKPVITVGSVGLDGEFIASFVGQGSRRVGIEQLEERFERGEFDLVAVGRALLQDPEWVEKVQQGRVDEIRDYDAASREVLY